MLNDSERRSDSMLTVLGFMPVALLSWIVCDALMLLIGGKSTGYSGWKQWNYVLWIVTPRDAAGRTGADRFLSFFLLVPAVWSSCCSGAVCSSGIRRRTVSTSRQRLGILAASLMLQCIGLWLVVQESGVSFWWSAPHTGIPALAVRVFEIGTIIAWFASPFLVYWITMPLMQLWNGRHRLPPDASTLERLHSRQE